MSAEFGYTPLTEANTTRVKVGVKLPYQLNEGVGLSIPRTEMLMQIAGIREIVLINDTAPTISISGISGNGTAVGVSVARVPMSRERNIQKEALPNCTWSSLEVAINEEVVRQKFKKQKKDERNPANWARVVDNAIKDGIIAGGSDNLLKRDRLVYITAAGLTLLFGSFVKDNLLTTTAIAVGVCAIEPIASIQNYGKERPGAGRRWSIAPLFLPEIDRTLVLNLITPMTKLAKEIR